MQVLGKRASKNLIKEIKLASSYNANSMDLPDPLSAPASIVSPSREVFQATSCISTKQLHIGSSWLSNLWKCPQEYIASEFVLTSPAVSRMPDSSDLDSFRDGW